MQWHEYQLQTLRYLPLRILIIENDIYNNYKNNNNNLAMHAYLISVPMEIQNPNTESCLHYILNNYFHAVRKKYVIITSIVKEKTSPGSWSTVKVKSKKKQLLLNSNEIDCTKLTCFRTTSN